MERLIANDLIYGRLMPVTRPHMVERYNAALACFDAEPTRLTSFNVDATGFSPEVAEELEDPRYLDPHGVNRRFIILSPEQGQLPVVQLNFSSTSDLVRAFYRRNLDALKRLTLKDVVFGEIENATYRVNDLDDILSIKSIEFRVKTVSGLLEKATELAGLVDKFQTDGEAWRDDVFLRRITELASECGDIRYNNLVPRSVRFHQRSFWTRHFGGLYVFHDEGSDPTVVGRAKDPEFVDEDVSSRSYFSFEDPDEVYDFLVSSGRVEPLNFEWLQRSDILKHREHSYVRAAIARAQPELDVTQLNEAWIRNWVSENYDQLANEGLLPELVKLRKVVASRQTIPRKLNGATYKFMMVRAVPEHSEQRLINRLISDFVPFDYLMRFIYNKEAFYADYEQFGDNLREFVVDLISTQYFPDKAGLRRRFYE